MSLPGKVAAVLLLGLLAAQGKRRAPRSATTRCQPPPYKKKCASIDLDLAFTYALLVIQLITPLASCLRNSRALGNNLRRQRTLGRSERLQLVSSHG